MAEMQTISYYSTQYTVKTVFERSSDLATGYLKLHYDGKESVKVNYEIRG
jgi:hypothetical protein